MSIDNRRRGTRCKISSAYRSIPKSISLSIYFNSGNLLIISDSGLIYIYIYINKVIVLVHMLEEYLFDVYEIYILYQHC